MSRAARPKQLLPLFGGRCLLDLAVERLNGAVPPEHRLICTAERYRPLIREVIPELNDEQVLGEPVGRNTVNAIGLTATALLDGDEDPVFAVLTADHLIEPADEFQRRLDVGFQLVEAAPHRMVTFSVEPTYPATAYGYVEHGEPIPGFAEAYRARRFQEKPDRPTAEEYVKAGTFGWNSGMFVFHARTYLDALQRHLPGSAEGLASIGEAWGTPSRRETMSRIYPDLPSISVDYAVMEPAAKDRAIELCAVEMRLSWTDVGSWPAYGRTLTADGAGNRASGEADLLDCHNVLTVSEDPGHTITAIGCKDLIVIHTPDATLVCPIHLAEQVGKMAEQVKEELR